MTARIQRDAVAAAGDQLRAIIERIERLLEERQTIASDVREVYAEAKGNGFDTPAVKTIIKRRAQDAGELAEQDKILEAYMKALGMLR